MPAPIVARPQPGSQAPGFARPALIVFDKDGTLIDYHAMWSGWIEQVADRLSAVSGRPLRADYLVFAGYDTATRRTRPGGRLATTTMATLYALTEQWLHGLGVPAAAQVMARAWSVPDPIHSAQATTDLGRLFTELRALGCRLTVATSDDHAPAVATLYNLGVLHQLEAIVGADDGVPVKPAPHMVWELCRATGVVPEQTLVVGDTLDDMHMAKAAGAMAFGVLTGITPAEQLRAVADHVLDGVYQLPALLARPAG
jgi:phosphoglycolate phosphatase